jgi:hypothetical protein
MLLWWQGRGRGEMWSPLPQVLTLSRQEQQPSSPLSFPPSCPPSLLLLVVRLALRRLRRQLLRLMLVDLWEALTAQVQAQLLRLVQVQG